MNLIELISFIVSFALFVFLMARRAMVDMRRRQEQPVDIFDEMVEEEEEEEEEEVVEKVVPPLRKKIPPKPHPKPHVYEPSHYEVHTTKASSRADVLLQELPELKNMLIYHEIFGPPKSLQ